MVEIDKVIDNKPTKPLVRELAELRIRNLQAFRELQEYNNNGKFMFVHPLIVHYSLRQELKTMLENNSNMFLQEYANTRENVKRYKSYYNNPKRDDEKKKRDKQNIKKHSEKLAIMEEIVNDSITR